MIIDDPTSTAWDSYLLPANFTALRGDRYLELTRLDFVAPDNGASGSIRLGELPATSLNHEAYNLKA